MRDLNWKELQRLLDQAAKECCQSIVDYLRFQLG